MQEYEKHAVRDEVRNRQVQEMNMNQREGADPRADR